MSALPEVAPKVRVIWYLPITDNMTDGDATRPGDILRIRNGKTVEVLNTDAEGRLILADALVLARASSSASPKDRSHASAASTGSCPGKTATTRGSISMRDVRKRLASSSHS
jgi:leucyl aminopeptidase